MRIIIQKFGGTSVNSSETRNMAAQKIINALKSGFQPVVVVSAIGRKGTPYSTDSLIELVESEYKDTHPRELDIVMSCGEIISAVVMVNTLRSKGYDGVAVSGQRAGIITDNNFGSAEILKIKPDYILEILDRGKIPIVAGFQGATIDGEITTLGRGGSDITASALGDALSADFIEIYTDVDGIMTADPRIVPNTTLKKHISYSEVLQIADQGAKVIHPRAVEIAKKSNIAIIIKNTMNDSPGTVISNFPNSEYRSKRHSDRIITSIAHTPDRTQIIIENIRFERKNEIFLQLAENEISIDIINIFPDRMVFTIESKLLSKCKAALDTMKCNYQINGNCSKISAVGDQMRGVPGVMFRIIRALTSKNIEILQTSDSHNSISCLVKGEDTVKAVLALHEEFELYKK